MSATSDGADNRPQAMTSPPMKTIAVTPLSILTSDEYRQFSSTPQLSTLVDSAATTSSTTSSFSPTPTTAPVISPRVRQHASLTRSLGSNSNLPASSSMASLPVRSRSVQSLRNITVHAGFLTKKGGRGLQQNWRKRWFVLTADKRLFYYASQRDPEPKGIIDLEKYTEVVEVEGAWPRVHRFNLLNKDTRLNIRTFYLVSPTKSENDEWMAKIMRIISGKEAPAIPSRISVFDMHAVRRPPSSVLDGGVTQELYVALKVQLGLQKLVEYYTTQNESTLCAIAQKQLDSHQQQLNQLQSSADKVPDMPKILALAESTSYHQYWLPPLPKSQTRKHIYVLL